MRNPVETKLIPMPREVRTSVLSEIQRMYTKTGGYISDFDTLRPPFITVHIAGACLLLHNKFD